ncbi:hypothetical protein H5410_023309 [Solanum commersonii]|uniref:Uncharacterized protein n=1 Tax=Solanum commersonii TaxID=4109 RepID=A0A9J5ZJF1_SOLCO|nr:hypothetical protein H5410_023309 [Solanum commersonii]
MLPGTLTSKISEQLGTTTSGGESASRWADLVEEENHTPSPSRSKLSPQTLEFVPTSKVVKEVDLSPRQQIKKWKHQMQKEDT